MAKHLASLTGALGCWLFHRDHGLTAGPSDPAFAVIDDLLSDLATEVFETRPAPDTGAYRRWTLHGRTILLARFKAPTASGSEGWICFFAFQDDAHAAQSEPRLPAAIGLADMVLATHAHSLTLRADLQDTIDILDTLRRQVETDPLTEVLNTRTFARQAKIRLDETGPKFGVLLFDIDHFKRVNDFFGHAFGDKYLQSVARALTTALPEDALIGRIGGDEFAAVITLRGVSTTYAVDLMTRCRSSVQRVGAILGRPELGRISMGASFSPDHGTTYLELFENADAALYAAKAAGRGTTVIYDDARCGMHKNRELERQFKRACRDDEIVPFFQPIVDLDTGQTVGFELLTRWLLPEGGLRHPGDFKALFEDLRTAEHLTRTVLAKGLRQFTQAMAQSDPSGPTLRLAINLSAFDLMNPEFAFELQAELNQNDLDWPMITIEVTENVVLGDDNGQIRRNLEELRARGSKIAMDDFGTGHGGLLHLRDWPIDVLKIDRKFIQRIDLGRRDLAVVEAILGIAHRSGFEVVAEGIETIRQLDALLHLGCKHGQGYLFSQAMHPDSLPTAPPFYDLPALRRGHLSVVGS